MKSAAVTPSPEVLRLLDRMEIAIWEVRRGRPGGSLPSLHLGLGTRFRDFRRYTPGDDLRYLDWNALGRLGEPFIKQFAREEAGRLTLLVDRTASMATLPGADLTARSVTAVLAYTALGAGYEVDIVPVPLMDGRVASPVGGFLGRGTSGEMFDWIAGLTFDTPAPLFPALRSSVGSRELGTATFLISDLADADAGDRIFRYLRAKRCQPALVQIEPVDERAWLRLGHREMIDPESGRILSLRVTPSVRRSYLEQLQRFRERVRHRCRALGVRHVCFPAGHRADRTMVQALREGGILR